MNALQKRLFELAESDFADFHSRLIPEIDSEKVMGVRVPNIRKFASVYEKENEAEEFLDSLPHVYYEENMLHGIMISRIKDFDLCIEALEKFLPYTDNWAVCDSLRPACFVKNKEKLLPYIKKWIASEHPFVCRFAIEMLMVHFLEDDFKVEYAKAVADIRSEEYYVKMMIAWYFATALAKQWDDAVPFIENCSLDEWTHNKAIQKSVESYRITKVQKEYLRTLKRCC